MTTRGIGLSLRAQYDFRPDVLDVIISGRSMIDALPQLHLRSHDEAYRFIRSYGYDLDNPIERAEVMGNFREALNFVRKFFLQPENPAGLKIEIPRKILEIQDLGDLFLMAGASLPGQGNDSAGMNLRNWACSLLKIMHTIAHIDKDLRSPHFIDIQMQILDRFYKVVHRDPDGQLYIGDLSSDGDRPPFRLNLVAFETKPKKSRDSIILKLLHKPENVAEELFDRVGIRFVTETPLGALRVVKYLRDQMIVMPPNIKPSRSRNTLVDLEEFRRRFGEIMERADRGELGDADVLAQLEDAAHPPVTTSENPHSSEFYRAIQFTCRQLIKLKNPLYSDLKELKAQARANQAAFADLLRTIERIDLTQLQKEVRFFYPYEIQIMDRRSAEENERGKSAHGQYKRAQVQTAMKRVMGPLMGPMGAGDAVRQ